MDDAQLAAIAAEAYGAAPSWCAGDVHALAVNRADFPIIAVRGTTADPADWLRDLSALPERDPDLGWCHRGFLDGARALSGAIMASGADLRGAILVGHSMGGAIALLLAGMLIARNVPVRAVVAFGAPRCGSWKLRRVLRRIPLRLYRNGDDPVPDVPFLPGFYVHPCALIAVGEPALDPIADHAIASYRRTLTSSEEKTP